VTLRARLVVAAAAAVAVAVVLASVLAWVLVRQQLRAEIDDALRARAEVVSDVSITPEARIAEVLRALPPPRPGAAPGYVQLVTDEGRTIRSAGATAEVPVSPRTLAVASGIEDAFLDDSTIDGVHARVLTVPFRSLLGGGAALQIVRPLDEVDRVLDRLRVLLAFVAAGGVALAALLGYAVSRATIAPVRRLTEATEHVRLTGDLARRLETSDAEDEVGRLATSFNAMLGALEASLRAQRQLVADASHELRTPLTSLRTNIEVLRRADELSPEERERLVRDLSAQAVELSSLVEDLIELARGNAPPAEVQDVRLDEVAAAAVERARARAPHLEFRPQLEPTLVRGVAPRIDRAVANLLDNAAKWSPPGEPVEVAVRGGEVVVRDHGPGIADADLPHVFDRFYRSPSARGLPGSGLGLAIVRQVAESHGGSVSAEHAHGGGALLRLSLTPVDGVDPAPQQDGNTP
jgi:two-component system, OmpR family, sensor histidine kinase MprB